MPQKKKVHTQLGRAIIKQRFQGNRPVDDDTRLFSVANEAGVSLQSVTVENDLDNFLRNAELADKEFAAQRRNVQIITTDSNPFLLSEEKEREMLLKMDEMKTQLTVPRRPQWDADTSVEQLQSNERESFLQWRHSLSKLEEEKGMLLTPYERNLEVWRQLWRVIERSDVVVQILDARNPLFFRSADLESYVTECGKQNLLLINKSDLLSLQQRRGWAKYFNENGVQFAFFSAMLEEDYVPDSDGEEKVITCSELCDLFMKFKLDDQYYVNVGLTGHPNVGKSSTINSLLPVKKVTVSSTPGKTKHFQTLQGMIPTHPQITMCDCPGLVFPSFATTKADMVLNGVLNIDELREFRAPAEILARRIPRWYLEWKYGIKFDFTSMDDVSTRQPTGVELLTAYAKMRGFAKSGQGNPDESRAARIILKDYINARIVYLMPPPGIDSEEFNAHTYAEGGTKHADYLEAQQKIDAKPLPQQQTPRTNQFDKDYFQDGGAKQIQGKISGKFKTVQNFNRVNLYPHQSGYVMATDGRGVLGTQVDPSVRSSETLTSFAEVAQSGKKHHKNNKKKTKSHDWRV